MFGYYYQPLISDMCDMKNPMTGINISIDAARWDIQTRSMFNWVPNNFSSFSYTPYMGGSYDFNGIFNATLAQMNQQNMMQYGTPLFGANGQINMPNFGMANIPQINTSNFQTPETTGVSGGNNEQQKKYTKLVSLLKQLAEYEELSPSKRDELKTAANRPQGKNLEEKYDYLLDVYKSVDKDIRKEFLLQAKSLGADGTYNSANKNSFYEKLLASGYELTTDLDDRIPDLYSTINMLSNDNANGMDKDYILGQLVSPSSCYDILDVVSSWNSEYPSEKLITKVAGKYNSLNAEAKATAKTTYLDPILSSMIKKAQSARTGLSEASKDKINKATEPLKAALNNSKLDKITPELSKAFDNLYIILRLATIEKVRSDAKDYYGEIDSEVFNDDLFKAETEEDLKKEGFTDKQIKDGAVEARNTGSEDEGNGGVDETTTPATPEEKAKAEAEAKKQKAQDFVASDKVEEFTTSDGKTCYEEKVTTGGRNYKRVFLVNPKGELVEWTNVRRGGNKVFKIDSTKPTPTKSVDVETVEQEIATTIEDIADLEYNGKVVARKLCEWTTSEDDKYIKEQLDKVNKDNIMTFMKGIYSNSKFDHKGCEGFIEKLDDDTNIDFDIKKKFIEIFIEAAIEAGMDSTDALIKELRDLVQNGRGGFWGGSNGFNKTISGLPGIWRTNYNEKIDEVMFDIYQKLNGSSES